MNTLSIAAAVVLTLGLAAPARPQAAAAPKREATTMHARGTFEVKLNPLAAYAGDDAAGAPVGRMSIDKQFRGDLEATSKGEMLTGGDPSKGSAGYVAIERVSGTLGGRTGTFVLQHSGTMRRGEAELTITVVPDSGTGALAGISGRMTIDITPGKHSYDFEYTLAGAP
jgi:hypothetical protein